MGEMTVRKGPRGEAVSVLGYGAMRLPTVDGRHANGWDRTNYSDNGIDQEMLNGQIRYLLEHGVTYFDTSPAYCRGESERCLGEALARSGVPRARFQVATKLSNFAAEQRSAEASRRMFEKSLAELRTDYVDYYLLHNVGGEGFRERFVDNGMIDWLFEQKRLGRIRNLGWSYHGDPATVAWLLARHDEGHYRWDFAQIQMNYVDWRHAKSVNDRNLNAEYLYGELTRRGIPVVVMEPLLGGRLARTNHALEQHLRPLDEKATLASWALRFCASHENVLTVLSGMTRWSDVEENCRTLSPLKPLTAAEFATLEEAARAYLHCGLVPCTGCEYCMPCPYGIDIPANLKFRNDFLTKESGRSAREILRAYERAVPNPLRRAEYCTGCGICRPHCPQQIGIPGEIAEIDRALETLKDEEVNR